MFRVAVVMAGLLSVAATVHAGEIGLSWDPSPDSTVTGYRIYYGTSSGVYTTSVDVGNTTVHVQQNLTTGTRYYVVVRAYNATGTLSTSSNEVNGLAASSTTNTFTDHPLTPGVHALRTVHISELRTRIGTLRSQRGLAPMAWTDSTLTAGATVILATHIMQMRTALNAVYTSMSRPLPTYSDLTLSTGLTIIRAVHIAELRAAVVALE